MSVEVETNKTCVREWAPASGPLGFLLEHPPVIVGESPDEYRTLSERFERELQPKNLFERIWMIDIVDFTWEAIRLKALKAGAVNNERRRAMAHILSEVMSDQDFPSPAVRSQACVLARQWLEGDAACRDATMERLAQSGFSIESVAAQAANIAVKALQALDDMLGKVLRRRDAALRNVQKHRKQFAASLRNRSDAELAGGQEGSTGGPIRDERSSLQ